MKRYFALVALALLSFSATTFSQLAEREPKAVAEWTFMFYMDSDNDLEAAQMMDLVEMSQVGTTDKVNIVALVDRHPGSNVEDGYIGEFSELDEFSDTRLMLVEKGKITTLANVGELNMGDPANIVKFVREAVKFFPAKRYALVFGDHGSGWPRILGDETDKSALTMRTLAAGLDATNKLIGGKLELLGFDACLMANYEVTKSVAPYAKAMVSSEELEPGAGWSYTPIMQRINAAPASDGFAVGRIIVDEYSKFYKSPDQGNRVANITLSLKDLSKTDAVTVAVNDLSTNVQRYMKAGGRAAVNATGMARLRSEEHGANDRGKTGAEFLDLVHFAENIKLYSKDAGIAKAADNVIAAVKAMVLYKVNGDAHPRSHGLSIYFPKSKQKIAESGYGQQAFAKSLMWTNVLNEYSGIISNDTTKPDVSPAVVSNPGVEKDAEVTVTANVKADDIDEATFILAEKSKDSIILIGAIPTEPDEKGKLTETWDGTWFAISDGKVESICPITDFSEIDGQQDVYVVEVPAQARRKGRNTWKGVTLYFELDLSKDEPTGEFIYAFAESNGQQREFELHVGDSVRPVYVQITEDGEPEEIAATDESDYLTVSKDDGLFIGATEVATGDYLIGFLVTDLAGNDSESLVEVSMK
ncbi:MAG TPA: clostripain-related cysteine peptidase [Pyrinomonadaceae bacterium]|nr:clostripain-related cysteine peptidase [Pyrinomonadaceae bacterium]